MAFNVGAIHGSVKLDTAGFQKAVATINKGQGQMKTQAGGASSAFKSLWKQVAVGLGVGAGVAMAIRSITTQISDTIQKGREFEKEWANVTTMMTLSKNETDKMRKELIALSPTLGDTTALAKGMYQVLSASVEPAKAIEFLGVAAKAAKAGLTDVFTSVDALTTVINAYGLEAEQATEISDIMFQTVKRGKLNFGELAHSLGTVVPVAATLGVDFKEVSAAISAMTRQGIKAQTATMQLRQVMMAILKPSEQALEAAESLGLEWNANALASKGLAKFLFDMKEKIGGNTAAYGKLVPNVRALTGVMVLAGKASAGFAYDLKLMEKSSGSMEVAFRKQMMSMDFWLDAVKVSFDKAKISFYEGFVEPMRQGITDSKEFETQTKSMTESSRAFGGILGEVVNQGIKLVGPWLQKEAKQLTGNKIAWASLQDKITGSTKARAKVLEQLGDEAALWLDATKRVKGHRTELAGWSGVAIDAMHWWKDQVDMMIDSGKSTEEYLEILLRTKRSMEDTKKPAKDLTETFKELSLKTRTELNEELRKLESVLYDDAAKAKLTERSIAGLAERAMALRAELKLRLNPALEDMAYSLGVTIPPKARDLSGVFYNVQTSLKQAKYQSHDFTKAFDKNMNSVIGSVFEAREPLKVVFFDTPKKMKINWENVTQDISRYWTSAMAEMAEEGVNFSDIMHHTWQSLSVGMGSAASNALAELGKVGAAFGPVVGTAVSVITSGIGKLFGIKSKAQKEAEKAAKEAAALKKHIDDITKVTSKYGKISEDTAKKIQEADKSMQGFAAVSKYFGDVIGDVGVNQDNINKLWERASDIIHHVKEGSLSAGEGIAALDESFSLLLEGAKDLGEEGSDAMVNFILKLRESGLEVKSVTEYVVNQLDRIPDALESLASSIPSVSAEMGVVTEKMTELKQKVLELQHAQSELNTDTKEGREKYRDIEKEIQNYVGELSSLSSELTSLQKMQSTYAGENEEELQRLGMLSLQTFNSMIGSGVSWMDAVNEMKDPLIALRDKYGELHLTADDALKRLFEIVGVTEENKELFEAIDANKTIMEALGNSGWMTQEIFSSFATTAYDDFKKLQEQFGNDDDALRAMQPTLQSLQDYANAYNLEIDSGTQSLIDQATQLGLVKDKKAEEMAAQEKLFDRLGDRIGKIMGEVTDRIGGYFKTAFSDAFSDAQENAKNMATNINKTITDIKPRIDVDFDYTIPKFDFGGEGVEFAGGFQHGGVVEAGPHSPTMLIIGEGSEREVAKIGPKGSESEPGGSPMTLNMPLTINVQRLDDNEIHRVGEKIYDEVKWQMKRGRDKF